MVTQSDIVNAARQWIDTPYAHQGRTIGVEADCFGLVVSVAHQLGLSDYDIDGYSREADGILMAKTLRSQMVEISRNLIVPGAVLHLAFKRVPLHLAIVTTIKPTYIIHSFSHSRRVVEHRLSSLWSRRIRGVYRFSGVTE